MTGCSGIAAATNDNAHPDADQDNEEAESQD